MKAEKYILKMLEWDLKAPGPMGWLRRGSKADGCEVQARTIAKYLLEIGCLERKLIGVVPSKVSAAALWLARLALGREEWVSEDLILIYSKMLMMVVLDCQSRALYNLFRARTIASCRFND